jgi:hypothetical protein
MNEPAVPVAPVRSHGNLASSHFVADVTRTDRSSVRPARRQKLIGNEKILR